MLAWFHAMRCVNVTSRQRWRSEWTSRQRRKSSRISGKRTRRPWYHTSTMQACMGAWNLCWCDPHRSMSDKLRPEGLIGDFLPDDDGLYLYLIRENHGVFFLPRLCCWQLCAHLPLLRAEPYGVHAHARRRFFFCVCFGPISIRNCLRPVGYNTLVYNRVGRRCFLSLANPPPGALRPRPDARCCFFGAFCQQSKIEARQGRRRGWRHTCGQVKSAPPPWRASSSVFIVVIVVRHNMTRLVRSKQILTMPAGAQYCRR